MSEIKDHKKKSNKKPKKEESSEDEKIEIIAKKKEIKEEPEQEIQPLMLTKTHKHCLIDFLDILQYDRAFFAKEEDHNMVIDYVRRRLLF